jgi:phage recombination protein Bet
MAQENLTGRAAQPSLVHKFAAKFGIESEKLLATLKATAFKQRDNDEPISNEQMAALLIVADQYGLNPFTKEIFAFSDKRAGIIPVVSVDGWARIINENPAFDGVEFRQAEAMTEPVGGRPCPDWIECVIYRKDRSHPIVVREYLDECYRKPFGGTSKTGKEYTVDGPWQTHTKRFLRHKSLIQCARIAFGFAGIYDEDEAHRIIEGTAARMAEPAALAEQPPAQTGTDKLKAIARAAPTMKVPPVARQPEREPVNAADAPPQSPPADKETGEITVTYADLMSRVNRARNADDLTVVLDLIRYLPADQQSEVRQEINVKLKKVNEDGG